MERYSIPVTLSPQQRRILLQKYKKASSVSVSYTHLDVYKRQPLTLSPMEYKMLNLFRKNPRQVLTRGQLLEKLWDIDERFVDEHTLTTRWV